mgnify:CR=1 FL=1
MTTFGFAIRLEGVRQHGSADDAQELNEAAWVGMFLSAFAIGCCVSVLGRARPPLRLMLPIHGRGRLWGWLLVFLILWVAAYAVAVFVLVFELRGAGMLSDFLGSAIRAGLSRFS